MFEIKREDGRSYRMVALDVLKQLKPDEIVTYQDLGRALELDPIKDRARIQQSARAALKTLQRMHQRGISVVPGVGYRMLAAREHRHAGDAHQSKAERQMVRAIDFFDSANLSEMTEIERRLHQGQAMLAHALYASHKHLDKRMKRLEVLLGKSDDEPPIIDHDG